MIMSRAMMKPLNVTLPLAVVAALALAGCAAGGGTNFTMGGGAPKPKVVVVTDFSASSEVEAIDRGFSVRMDRKDPNFPILERRRRTLSRVNDEIVATVVATLREAGLDAEPGSEDRISLKDQTILVNGDLRPASLSDLAKKARIGFGPGYGGVAAEMTLSSFSFGGKKRLLTFVAQAPGKHAAGNRKEVAARDAAINAALGAEGTAAVKLSPETETQARRLGRAIGEHIAAFAREQGWMSQGETAAEPAAAPAADPDAGETPMSTPMPPRRPPPPAPKPAPPPA
jgi:hypothetical protein